VPVSPCRRPFHLWPLFHQRNFQLLAGLTGTVAGSSARALGAAWHDLEIAEGTAAVDNTAGPGDTAAAAAAAAVAATGLAVEGAHECCR